MNQVDEPRSWAYGLGGNVLVGLGYVGLVFAVAGFLPGPPAFWPSTGIGVFAALAGGWAWMPGVFLGAFGAHTLAGDASLLALLLAMGNVLVPMLMRHVLVGLGFNLSALLDSLRGVAAFMVGMVGVGGLLAAVWDVGVRVFVGSVAEPWDVLLLTRLTDAMASSMVLAPVLWYWWRDARGELSERAPSEHLIIMSLIVLGVLAMLWLPDRNGLCWFGVLVFLLMPFAWLAVRYHPRDTLSLLLLLLSMALGWTLVGQGPFVGFDLLSPITSLLTIAISLGGAGLLVGALNLEMCRAFDAARAANRTLERRVADRTAEVLRSRNRLKASEQRLQHIIATIPTPLVLTRVRDGAILLANPAAAEVFGLGVPALTRMGTLDFWADLTQRDAFLRRVRAEGVVSNAEGVFRLENGEPMWLQLSSALTEADGEEALLTSFKDITAAKAREDDLVRLATTDALTGIGNRHALLEQAPRLFQQTRREKGLLTVMMLDVDFFKRVNDTYGHDCGDQVLRMIAQTLRSSLRDVDVLARFGGEEFVIILPGIGAMEGAQVAERLRGLIARQAVRCPDSPAFTITVSIGVCGGPLRAFHASVNLTRTLINLADKALYEAKRRGRNRVEIIPCEARDGMDAPFPELDEDERVP